MNKYAASEDDVGKLHKLISLLHNMKSKTMLDLAEAAMESKDSEAILSIINSRDISIMQKWVEFNKVGCTTAEEDENSELSQRLKKLREMQSGKVVPFMDAEEANG